MFFNLALAADSFCIDINIASEEELQEITGIGPVLAERIIKARPFFYIDELVKVSGIAEVKLANIKEQKLACVQSQAGLRPETNNQQQQQQQQQPEQAQPKTALSYPQNNPANKEIEVILSVSGLKNAAYDVKIAIEKEKVLSSIYNKNEDKWQSSHYYIRESFSGSSFEGTFRLKIREEGLNFQGEADILIRIRESGKSNYLEHKKKINITAPEYQESKTAAARDLAAVSQQVPGANISWRIFLIALSLAVSCGIIILILKRKMVK